MTDNQRADPETTRSPTATPRQNPGVKLAVEMGPLLVFFGTYFLIDLFAATAAFMVAMAASMIASWRLVGHIPPMLWVSGGVVAVMGGLTLYLQDELFIKLKPTIVNSIFSVTLLIGLAMKRPLLKTLFEMAFPPIDDAGWFKLTRNWALFFAFLAVLNEVIWRIFSEEFWVSFKVWGVMPITFTFALSQIPVMNKHLLGASKPADGERG